jgi:hypothetical protein
VCGKSSAQSGDGLDGELCTDHGEIEVAPDHQTKRSASYTNHLANRSEKLVDLKVTFHRRGLCLQRSLLSQEFVDELCHGGDYGKGASGGVQMSPHSCATIIRLLAAGGIGRAQVRLAALPPLPGSA